MTKILLTGANGYIGRNLLENLSHGNYEIYCTVRDKNRFSFIEKENIKIIELDFLDKSTLYRIPNDIDIVYYLMHSMSSSHKNFINLESEVANNFVEYIETTKVKQVIYLTGMLNEEKLSTHLESRQKVEQVLSKGKFNLTTLRAGIIIGAGSASFEIIRDLVEKLPIMVAPKWIKTKCQPISVIDVIKILTSIILKEGTYNQAYDISGEEILTYKQMLLEYAKYRKLKRFIISVPVLTPKLSSYWLYFVTSVPFALARSLVDSMSIDFIARNNYLVDLLDIKPLNYHESIASAFDKIKQNTVISRWTNAISNGKLDSNIEKYIKIPVKGCLIDKRSEFIKNREDVLNTLWCIGGQNGWLYANILWKFRGFIDKLVGGVGLNRYRRNARIIENGDVIDFWRVILANKEKGILILYAEMKLPGEAWLEFIVRNDKIYQKACFRPRGLSGRLYWYLLLPFHTLIFRGMLKQIVKKSE